MPSVPASQSRAVATSSSAAGTVTRKAMTSSRPTLGKEVLHPVEDRAVLVRGFRNRQHLAQLLHQLALLRGQARRRHHAEGDMKVSAPPRAEVGDALLSNAEAGAGLR